MAIDMDYGGNVGIATESQTTPLDDIDENIFRNLIFPHIFGNDADG
jgi:hypothetical protein